MVTVDSDTLIALVAVVTLPAAALGGIFFGGVVAAVVAVVGWFLLVPVLAILFEDEQLRLGEPSDPSAAESTKQKDPLETLRDRYARGDVSEAEFERRLERLLETEDVEVPPDATLADDAIDRDLERERAR